MTAVEGPTTQIKLSLQHIILIAAASYIIYVIASIFHAVMLHPLSKFPGPLHTSLSCLPYWKACITGQQVKWMQKLHSQYGPVVRYGPNELSYVDQDSTAWKAIHGHEKGGREFPKAKEWFVAPYNGEFTTSRDEAHE
jgi:hypothetical protein